MKTKVQPSVISQSPDVLSGASVFSGTRVPVRSLFDYLAGGHSMDEFLDDFPTVTREQAIELLHEVGSSLAIAKQ